MTDAPQAIVAGHICLDIIPAFEARTGAGGAWLEPGKLVKVGPAVISTGGAVSNTGIALHRLGVPTRLMGKVADDLIGHAILDFLRGINPPLAEGMIIARGEPSSYTVVISPPGVDRMFLHCPGVNDTFGADDLAYDKLPGARVFHFGYPPIMRRLYSDGGYELESLLSRVRQRGILTSLDMVMPDAQSDSRRVDWTELLERVLPQVDIFMPSLDEMLVMLRRTEAISDGALLGEIAGQCLDWGARIVGLKLGDQGLYLRTRDHAQPGWTNRELLAPCFQVDVAGTTGSGDATIAGFLKGVLENYTPEAVMKIATAVGACCCECADATSGVPPWKDLQDRLKGNWPLLPINLRLPGWTWVESSGLWRGPNDQAR
jgi:sugar/nucleoside kinase (ribokinase family)